MFPRSSSNHGTTSERSCAVNVYDAGFATTFPSKSRTGSLAHSRDSTCGAHAESPKTDVIAEWAFANWRGSSRRLRLPRASTGPQVDPRGRAGVGRRFLLRTDPYAHVAPAPRRRVRRGVPRARRLRVRD